MGKWEWTFLVVTGLVLAQFVTLFVFGWVNWVDTVTVVAACLIAVLTFLTVTR